MLRIILNVIALLGVLVGVSAYLHWKRPPRPVLFGAVFFSTWIYVISYWMTAGVLAQFSDDLPGGVIPIIAAVVPVFPFLGWFLRGTNVIRK